MPRRGENIYRRKDGRWEGRYIKSHSGKKTHYGYVYAKTYREVKEKLAGLQMSEIREDPEACEKNPEQTGATFRVISGEWLDFGKNRWKKSSIVKYGNILKHYLLPRYADTELTQITREDAILFANELLEKGGKSGGGLSPKTVSDVLSVLKNIFEFAALEKGLNTASFERVSIKQSPKPMRVLTRREQEQLSRYLYDNLDLCNLGILVCLYTGLRIGEICALKWEDISLNEQSIYVHRTMQRIQVEDGDTRTIVQISSPKSISSIRRVPVPDNLTRILKEKHGADQEYFLTGNPNRYVEPRTLENHFKSAIKNCRIEPANYHSLRHTFATRCIELGFDVKSLSEILGHANVNITMNRYVHPSMELKQKNMNMLAELFAVT